MSEQKDNQEKLTDSTQSDDKINNVVALTQLVGTIVDYYSFKNKLIEDEESDKWKKDSADEEMIIPKKIDSIIEKSFISQLNKFLE